MLEEYGFTHFMEALDTFFAWVLNNNLVTGTVIKVNQYAPILEGYLSDLYFFFPKDTILFFAELCLGIMFIRIVLAAVNLAWW